MMVESRSVSTVSRFAAFVLWTCIGYVLFEIFLRGVDPAVLLLNTFIWQFVFCIFDVKQRKLRSPFRSFRYLIDRHFLIYAVALYAYWFLFWFGAAALPSNENAASMAISFLALNTIASPLALICANSYGNRRGALFVSLIGTFLAVAIAFMEFDAPVASLFSHLNGVETALHDFIGDRQITGQQADLPSIGDENAGFWSYVTAVICFLLAVAAEAIADFIKRRRELLADSPLGARLFQMEVASRVISRANRVISVGEIGFISDLAVKVEIASLERLEVDRIKARDNLADLELSASLRDSLQKGAFDADIRLAHQTIVKLDHDLEAADRRIAELRNSINFSRSGDVQARSSIKRLRERIRLRYWSAICGFVEQDQKASIEGRTSEEMDKASGDLLAVLGLVISVILIASSLNRAKESMYIEPVTKICALMGLGFFGSTARIAFLSSYLGKNKKAGALVPPLYAIRPVVLFFMFLAVNKLGVISFIKLHGFALYVSNPVLHLNMGWLIGAFMACAVALAVWGNEFLNRRESSVEVSSPPQNGGNSQS